MKILNGDFARNPHEAHRVATPLELFLDLVYVVAIAGAGAGFHHMLAEHHAAAGTLWYALAFFAIFMCWLNFSWYASSYDTQDTAFKLITFIQIFGALVLAVGAGNFFNEKHNLAVPIAGYVIMRIAMVLHWLRAAMGDPQRRKTCIAYAVGIFIVQIFWVLNYFNKTESAYYIMAVIVFLEFLVPFVAERLSSGTPWHAHHIAERYSLLTIIVLGEGILAATANISGLINSETRWTEAFLLGFGSIALVFALWWSYFKIPFGEVLHKNHKTMLVPFVFGYGHYFIFASLAAVGVGLQMVAEAAISPKSVSGEAQYALLCVAVPEIIYLLMMSFYRTLFFKKSNLNWLSWLVSAFLPLIPLLLCKMGIPLYWAVCTAFIAPAIFIVLNNFDEAKVCLNIEE